MIASCGLRGILIIDIHCHPRFIEPQQGSMPSQPNPEKLDIIANPRQFGIAAGQTAHHYFGRNPVLLSLADFIKQLDEAKIDKVGLINPALKGVPVRPGNEQVGRLLKTYPEKLLGFAGFDPNTGEESVREIEYAVKELGFSGVKTVASFVGLDINDKAFYPSYAKAEELQVPILIHTGSAILEGVRVKHVQAQMIDDVAFDFPDLKIICSHLGGWQYMDLIGLLVRHSNVFADISFWPLNPLYTDLVPWGLLEKAVPEKILFGSDYPAGQTPKEAAEAVKKLPVSESFKAKILGDNAARLLRL